jgi:FkbM family methyltransferase
MIVHTLRKLLPKVIKSFILRVIDHPAGKKVFVFLNDLDTLLTKIFYKNKEYYSFKFNGHNVVGNVRFSQGTNDDSIYKVITEILKSIEINDSDYLFDIGSNIGLTSIVMSDASFQRANIIAFEPGNQVKFLRKNVESCKLGSVIKVEEMAVYSQETTIDLYTYDESIVDSRIFLDDDWLKRNHNKIHRKTVQTCTFDQYIAKNKIDIEKVKFIKIDCQGAEPFIFDSMFEKIEPPKNINIVTEFWPYAILKMDRDPEELLLKIFSKFSNFNIYYFLNNSTSVLIHSIEEVMTLLNTLGTNESQYCDIVITKTLLNRGA